MVVTSPVQNSQMHWHLRLLLRSSESEERILVVYLKLKTDVSSHWPDEAHTRPIRPLRRLGASPTPQTGLDNLLTIPKRLTSRQYFCAARQPSIYEPQPFSLSASAAFIKLAQPARRQAAALSFYLTGATVVA